jgi:hypothetical protein
MNVSVDACYNGSVVRAKMKSCETIDVRRTAAREKGLGVRWTTISNIPFVIVILQLGETHEGIWVSHDGPKSAKSMPRPTEVTQYYQFQQQSLRGTESPC